MKVKESKEGKQKKKKEIEAGIKMVNKESQWRKIEGSKTESKRQTRKTERES